MEPFIQSLKPGLILRSLFAGLSFVFVYLAFLFSSGAFTHSRFTTEEALKVLAIAVPIGFFIGMTAYIAHRSAVYILIECLFDSVPVTWMRSKWPLIRARSVKSLIQRWCFSSNLALPVAERMKEGEGAQHLRTWADHVHYQYVSSLCMASGAWCGIKACPAESALFSKVITFAIVQWMFAFVSDWRLRCVWDEVLADRMPANQLSPDLEPGKAAASQP